MPSPGQEFTVTIERLDGGLNTKDSPANIAVTESPDALNVVHDDRGSVGTRNGASLLNTSTTETGSNVCDGLASYNGSMVAWFGGSMYRLSGTTFVTVASGQGQYASGSAVNWTIYQGMLIHSDGTNGPYRYHDSGSWYRLGIATPSAPTAASNVATAAGGGPEGGTYYYWCSYVNTATIEGEVGSNSVALVLGSTAVVNVTSIPTGAESLAAAQRYIYRSSGVSSTRRRVGTLANNTTSLFTDTMGATTWAVQTIDIQDASTPTPFTTVKTHKEVVWFDDSSNRTLLRYTDYGVPYISQAPNFIPLNRGDGSEIVAIGVQDDFVSVGKSESLWIVDMVTPADPTSYTWVKSPSNYGVVGARAFLELENGILFAGRKNERITGFHLLAGTRVLETSDSKLRSQSISERLESEILNFPSTGWSKIAMFLYNNQIFIAARKSGDSENAHIYWFDINRLGREGQPGSWELWDGRACKVNVFATHSGNLYAGSSLADGYVLQLEKSAQYNDAGAAINSYWWSKQFGGGEGMDSWVKDWRKLNMFYALLGDWDMNIKYRQGGDTSSGDTIELNLNPGGSLWGTMVWGTDSWGGAKNDNEVQLDLGTFQARRSQIRFDNQNTAGQAFRVYDMRLLGNLRRLV